MRWIAQAVMLGVIGMLLILMYVAAMVALR